MTRLEWFNHVYWSPVVMLVVGALVASLTLRLTGPGKARAIGTAVGGVILMTGLAMLTRFVWGFFGFWLMVISGVVFWVLIWRSRAGHPWLATFLVLLTNGWLITLMVIYVLSFWWGSGGVVP